MPPEAAFMPAGSPIYLVQIWIVILLAAYGGALLIGPCECEGEDGERISTDTSNSTLRLDWR